MLAKALSGKTTEKMMRLLAVMRSAYGNMAMAQANRDNDFKLMEMLSTQEGTHVRL